MSAVRIKNPEIINDIKLQAFLDVVRKAYPDKFNDIEIVIRPGHTRYQYDKDKDTQKMCNFEIVIGTISNKNFDDFIINYYNKTFGLNLENTDQTRAIQEICHECGHHYNKLIYENKEDEYMEHIYELEALNLTGDKKRTAYRQIDEEYDADIFAVELIKNHLNEFLEILNNGTE